MKCKLILILFIKQNVETEFTLDQLDDEFDNNDGKDVGIDGVIDNKNGNNFEVTRILVHFRGYQTRKSIREREKCKYMIQSAARHHLLRALCKMKRLYQAIYYSRLSSFNIIGSAKYIQQLFRFTLARTTGINLSTKYLKKNNISWY